MARRRRRPKIAGTARRPPRSKPAARAKRPPRVEPAAVEVRDSGAAETLIPGRIQPEVTLGRGPKKQRPGRTPAPRLDHHKARSLWFQARAAWPLREPPVHLIARAREEVRKSLPAFPGTAQWQGIGPTNIGGRLTSLVCDPGRPHRLWVGAAGGGVWHSPDAGATWQAQWHGQDVLNIGSLAIDPGDPDTIYCGTGEANLSADSYGGVGLWRTTDGGATWTLHAPLSRTGLPRRIGVIAIDPFDRQHIVIGGVGFGEVAFGEDLGGLCISRDGGATWTRQTFVSPYNHWCHSVVFDPSRRGTLYASFTARGASSGIYRSGDGGEAWTHLTAGLPSADRIGRATLALSASDPDVLYAYAADQASVRADRVLGVFRTRNGGASWTSVGGAHFAGEGQTSYNNTIAVDPLHPDHVLCGGVDLHLSTNGGRTWRTVTRWNAERGRPNYAHADHHALVMPPALPGRVYDANDGGLDLSDDGGLTWVNRSNGLAVTMYYDMDVAQSDRRVFGGGTQDNGTLITTTGGPSDHYEILGGDGGWIVFDRQDASHLYASYYNVHVFRYRRGTVREVSPPATPEEKAATWMAFIAMDPEDADTVYVGSTRLWRTEDDGESWRPLTATLDGSAISAIEVAAADPRRIYVGTENGGFYRSLDRGATWSANMASATLPGHTLTRLASVPGNADRLFATVANFGHSHVFRSDDGGATWQDVDRRLLPDVPHHAALVRPDQPDTVYVCNDVGVFVSLDAGGSWADLSRNLPHVMVVDLVYHVADAALHAASYGRSLWRLSLK
ncbi:MAG TPA: hypothetical protein VMR21_11675 [Vicinamibacteria bacterium]|nr:hypothetical protein [Vicinamibacteria bacterium]